MFDILIAEDDVNLNYLISKFLKDKGFNIITSFDGKQALDCVMSKKVDLLICDIIMPEISGPQLVKMIKRQRPDFPIIMLTALDTIEDKTICFQNGADDYLTKPVNVEELVLRINALLRRYQLSSLTNITHKELSLNYKDKKVTVNGKPLDLTKKEFLLLYMLLSVSGRILSRSNILDEVWGYDSESIERTVDVHINKLREKLKGTSVDIVTVRGLGYKAELK